MSIRRVALIFDNVVRPDTTGGYCLRALRDFAVVEHFLPRDVSRIPRTGFDLYLNVDDGLRYPFPGDLRPNAWWAIDTHLDADWAMEKGRQFDWVFAAQRDGVELLRQRGLCASWLPLACDPGAHKPHAVEKQWDVCFVGRVTHAVRGEALALVREHFPNMFIGERYFEDFARTYSAARIGFNRSVKNDVNMRVFETLACGPLLVTNDLRDNGQEELLQSDRHLLTYNGPEELVDKIRFYLRHDNLRERIARCGRDEVLARHTYGHRMRSLLGTIEAGGRTVHAAGPIPAACPSSDTGALCASTKEAGTSRGVYLLNGGPLPHAPADAGSVGHVSDIARIAVSCETVALSGCAPDGRESWLESIDMIIKTFLRPQALLRLLRSILTVYPAAHITIADDGNVREATDPESQACRALIDASPNVTLHALPFAAGVTPGRNLLVEQTSRAFLLLLDDDFCFTEETRIEKLLERLKSDHELGLVAGACIDVIDGDRRPRNSGGTLAIGDDRTLRIDSSAWRDEEAGLRDYVPHFAMLRREIFRDIGWEGGIGAEHYDFCLQLQRSRWKVAQDLSVRIDHHHFTPALPGYEKYRFDFEAAQQWLLRKWDLVRIVHDGRTIVERNDTLAFNGATAARPQEWTDSPGRRALPLKSPSYFDFARPEVAALVPAKASRILDVGCGNGRLGALLKQRQPAEVVGVELQADAAASARKQLNEVLEVSIDDPAVDFPPGRFDCVICADVLEHLREPGDVLSKIRRWLAPDGVLVASLPNVRHHSVVASLLDGNWTYEAAGLLDSDHVRFFTRREIEKLLFRHGFELAEMQAVPGPGYSEWRDAGSPGSLRIGGLRMEGLSREAAEEFFTYQHLVVARPSLPPKSCAVGQSLTSIVIVTHNQLSYTQGCVDSIRLRTDEPYELIFVDNGSSDGTVDYLRRVPGARLIENPDNRGFPSAANQGLGAARGDQVLFLNNDTVITTGWLRRMLDALQTDPRVGLVGPCSNNVSGAQMVPVGYQELASLDGFAWEWGKQHQGIVEETGRLIGFCLLIRRAVIDQIGPLDERFGIGCFEDDDFCRRAVNAGWKAVIARAAFVHHFGHATFRGAGVDLAGLLEENRRVYEKKWGLGDCSAEPSGWSADSPRLGGDKETNGHPRAPSPSLPLSLSPCLPATLETIPESTTQRGSGGSEPEIRNLNSEIACQSAIRLSLCMIVRDNESTIGPCLESIRPWVDEIIVVDTGSTDLTPKICREQGAEVHEFPWCDDFSAARNESLKHARGEWIFWMDSDDTISPECGKKLRALADEAHPERVLGYIMQVHCPGPGEDGEFDVTAVDHVKLIRNCPELRFEGRIHEQLLPAIRRAGGDVEWTDISVRHSGADHSPDGRQRKLERDLRILHRELEESPNHPFVLFNLGMTYADAKQFDEAVSYLEQCLAVSSPDESHLRKAFALLVSSLGQAGRHDEAWRRCQAGLALYPEDSELLFRWAMLQHHFGRLREAEETYLRVLSGKEPRHFSSVDRGLAGFKARHNLALVYDDMGRLDQAEQQWRLITEEVPRYAAGWRGLGDVLLRQNRLEAVERMVAQLAPHRCRLRREALILHGKLAAARGDLAGACAVLREADSSDRLDLEPLRVLCRLLFERGESESAELALQELCRRDPEDAAAHHNLGVMYIRRQKRQAAIQSLSRSLELRPDAPETRRQLEYAMQV